MYCLLQNTSLPIRFAAVVIALSLASCDQLSPPSSTSPKSTAATPAAGSATNATPAAAPSTSVTQFSVKDLATPEGKKTWTGLAGKQVEITGTVNDVDLAQVLQFGGRGGLSCLLVPKFQPSWRHAIPGQTVVVRGTVYTAPFFDNEATPLRDCVIVKVEGTPSREFTAEQISQILTDDADPAKAKAKHTLGADDQFARVVVSGKIRKINFGILELEHPGTPVISIHINDVVDANDKADLARCKVGDTVRASGLLEVHIEQTTKHCDASLGPAHLIFPK